MFIVLQYIQYDTEAMRELVAGTMDRVQIILTVCVCVDSLSTHTDCHLSLLTKATVNTTQPSQGWEENEEAIKDGMKDSHTVSMFDGLPLQNVGYISTVSTNQKRKGRERRKIAQLPRKFVIG